MDFKHLSLEDKDLFDKYLIPYKYSTCEYSFTNLFIWRKACDIQYSIFEDTLIIKKMDFDGSYHFMQPIGYTKENFKSIIDTLIQHKKEFNLNFLFKDAEENFIRDLKELYPYEFCIIEDRDNFDYIYDSASLITLSGKKLHGKRNHYNNFIKNNNYRIVDITEEIICECIKASRAWCHQNDCKGYLLYELKSIEELLKNKSKLAFVGMAIYVNDKLSAFTIGEKANDEMAIIHIEKADSTINGLYNFINKTFVEHYFSNMPFINREQDLGIEGLRKAKLAYNPIKLEAKYNINI